MGMRKVAVVGAGMTKFVRRAQETPKELAWESTRMALESCEMTMDDIDGVCLGTAPDAFDGVHLKGEYLSDGSGAWGKPYMRSYVGGGTGVFAPIQGWYHIASGMFDVVVVVAEGGYSLQASTPAASTLWPSYQQMFCWQPFSSSTSTTRTTTSRPTTSYTRSPRRCG